MNTLLEARVFSDLGVGTFDPRPQHSLIPLTLWTRDYLVTKSKTPRRRNTSTRL